MGLLIEFPNAVAASEYAERGVHHDLLTRVAELERDLSIVGQRISIDENKSFSSEREMRS